MEIRPYLSFNGDCNEALLLYKRAFRIDTLEVMRFSDLPPNPEWKIPEEYMDKVVQAALKLEDNFIRMSDSGPNSYVNVPESDRVSVCVESSVEDVKYAFEVLAEEGRVSMALTETFYSPCSGSVYDKFGVLWQFAAQP